MGPVSTVIYIVVSSFSLLLTECKGEVSSYPASCEARMRGDAAIVIPIPSDGTCCTGVKEEKLNSSMFLWFGYGNLISYCFLVLAVRVIV